MSYRALMACVWRAAPIIRPMNAFGHCSTSRHLSATSCCYLSRSGGNLDAQPKPSADRKPEPAQLEAMYLHLSESLPNFFTHPVNYKMYAMNLEFEDNIRNIRTRTLQEYVQTISLLRIYAHIKYAHVRVEVLKITKHTEDDSIKVRWRIIGVPGMFSRLFWQAWRLRARKPDSAAETDQRQVANWHDGFSIFYINADGLIQKHVVERVTPDDGREPMINKLNKIVNAKLGGVLGIAICPPGGNDVSLSAIIDLLSRFM